MIIYAFIGGLVSFSIQESVPENHLPSFKRALG